MSAKLLKKLDDDVVEDIVGEAVGEDVIPVLKALKKKKEHQELILAEKMGLEINTLRNMLYRLHQHNLVSSERRRDPENGWHVYWWSFQERGFEHLFTNLTKNNLSKLKKKLDRESKGSFYRCTSKCVRLEFDDAFGMDFRCPECGDLMDLSEADPDRVETLKKQISLLQELVNR